MQFRLEKVFNVTYHVTHGGVPAIQATVTVPRLERIESLNSYAFAPGDGHSYRPYEAEELTTVMINGLMYAQYRFKGVQVS